MARLSGKYCKQNKLNSSLLNTRKEFKKYNIKTTKDTLNNKIKPSSLLSIKIRKFFKYLLSFLFPLTYG